MSNTRLKQTRHNWGCLEPQVAIRKPWKCQLLQKQERERIEETLWRKSLGVVEWRHSIINATTVYLDELEIQFKDNEEELKLLKAITVTQEWYINIAWFQHRLWICSIKVPKDWQNSNLFTQNQVMEFLKDQKDHKPYTTTELQVLINAIPWKSSENRIEIIARLLQIPFVGFLNIRINGRNIIDRNKWVGIWTEPASWADTVVCVIDNNYKTIDFISADSDNSYSLILHKA